MSPPRPNLREAARRYVAALREEPKLRYFFLWTLVDDLGTAVSTWAGTVFVATIVRTPADMATFAIPMIWARLVGGVLAGPLADWNAARGPEALRRWRYKVVFWRYVALFVALSAVVALIALGRVTLPRMIAYFVCQQFVGSLGAPAQDAFFVDLLRVTRTQRDAPGEPARDETGAPREYKAHLLAGTALLSQVSAAASIAGLLAGGWLVNTVAGGRVWTLLAFDALTFLAFAVGTAVSLHPTRAPREFSPRQLLREPGGEPFALGAFARAAVGNATEGARALAGFVRRRENDAFTAMLVVIWGAGLLAQLYESRLILTGLLGMSMEGYRRVQLAKAACAVVTYGVVVGLGARVRSLGAIFAAAVALDGAVMALAGVAAGAARASHGDAATGVAVAAMTADTGLSVVFGAMAALAQKSCSSPALRGRILGGAALVGYLVAIVGQRLYPALSARIGQTSLLAWAGVAQVALVLGLVALPGRGPAGFRIVIDDEGSAT